MTPIRIREGSYAAMLVATTKLLKAVIDQPIIKPKHELSPVLITPSRRPILMRNR